MTLLLIYLFIAVGISFLCSILEAVLLSITPSYVEQIKSKSPKQAKTLLLVKNKLDESLSSILILNTFAHTMGAAGVGSQAYLVFGEKWETLIAFVLTLVILYFSEIIPKTLGATFWRQLALPSAAIIKVLVLIVYPLVWLATRITRVFGNKKGNEITREEIIALASLGHKGGSLVSQENEYLNNLLHLREIKIEQILTPRSVVHMAQEDMTVSQVLDDPETKQFSRMPIYGEDQDNVTGKVIRSELYQAERQGKGDTAIKEFALEITRVSEKLPVQNFLDICIKQKRHLFLVEDEFGQTAGVATLEDAIETMLGREIVDESDEVEDMQALAKEQYRDRLRQNKSDNKKQDSDDS